MDDSPQPRPRRAGLGLGVAVGIAIGLFVGLLVGVLVGFGLGTVTTRQVRRAADGAQEEPADVASPKALEREGFQLKFPGNWRVASEEDDFDPDAYFSIDSPGGSYVTVEVIDEPIAVDEEVRQCVADFVPEWISRPAKEPFTTWGGYEGLGLHLTGRTAYGDQGGVRIFAHSTDRGAFVVIEVYYDEGLEHATPGFELIRETFKLQLPAAPAEGARQL